MEFEADGWPRLHVSHTGQQKGSQYIAISKTFLDAAANFLEQFLARSVFQKADEWFYTAIDADEVRV
jgi:hypothetical protein